MLCVGPHSVDCLDLMWAITDWGKSQARSIKHKWNQYHPLFERICKKCLTWPPWIWGWVLIHRHGRPSGNRLSVWKWQNLSFCSKMFIPACMNGSKVKEKGFLHQHETRAPIWSAQRMDLGACGKEDTVKLVMTLSWYIGMYTKGGVIF